MSYCGIWTEAKVKEKCNMKTFYILKYQSYLKKFIRPPSTAVFQIGAKPPAFTAAQIITLNIAANISID